MNFCDSGKGPDFLCIGMPKCGTSWIYSLLNAHPKITMPSEKELHYFDVSEIKHHNSIFGRCLIKGWYGAFLRRQAFASAYTLIRDGDVPRFKYHFTSRDYSKYHSRFCKANNHISGDVTPTYAVLSERTINVISRKYPNIKILLVLRNPYRRAISNFNHILRWSKNLDLNNLSPEIIRENLFVDGEYDDYDLVIEKWSKYFSAERFKIIFFEQMLENKQEIGESIFKYLDLPVGDNEIIYPKPKNQGTVDVLPYLSVSTQMELAKKHLKQICILKERFKDSDNESVLDFWYDDVNSILDEGV